MRSILLVRFGALGDVAHTLPALDCVRRAHPQAEIHYAVDRRYAGLLEGHPQLDHVIRIDRPGLEEALRGGRLRAGRRIATALLGELRSLRFDTLLDFQADLKSALLGLSARAEQRVCLARGFAKEGNHLIGDVRVDPGSPCANKVDRYLSMARAIGADTTEPHPVVGHVAEAQARVAQQLAEVECGARHLAMIHPGVSQKGAIKRWHPERFAAVADHVARERGFDVLLTWGSPLERATCEEVRDKMRAPAHILRDAWSLPELVAALRRASLFVSVDSGPLHVASMLGVPHVAILGPKDPRVYGTRFGPSRSVVQYVACFPCRHRVCPTRPVERLCLEQTTAAMVIAAIDDLLDKEGPERALRSG